MNPTLFLLCTHLLFSYAKNGSTNHRIIGGSPANVAQYPYLAAIHKTTSNGQYFCGGSLISQRWILTAGQCVANATLFTIFLGTNNIKTIDKTGIILAAEEYVLHPDYNPATLKNDVGLIKLRMDVTYSTYIRNIDVASTDISSSTAFFQTTWSVGWGQRSDRSSELAETLQNVAVNVLENEECKITYGNQVTDDMVCVAGNYNEGTCHGDTGTPLISAYQLGKVQYQFGIASFVSGNGCESRDPSGYTRTWSYYYWILNVTTF